GAGGGGEGEAGGGPVAEVPGGGRPGQPEKGQGRHHTPEGQRADKPGGLPLVAAVPAVGVVAVVAAGVVEVMIGAGVVMVAEAEQAQQELAHQERAAHEGAAEVDRLVHGAPSPGGGTRTAPVRSGKVLIRGSRMRWESGSRSPAYSLLAADFTRFGGKKHVKKL